jgi:hypothetical protein
MFEPILERLSSYHRIISKNAKELFDFTINFLGNFNQYIILNIKKLQYDFEYKRECYLLGRYLGQLDGSKYDLSYDKVFMDHIDKINLKTAQINRNNNEITSLSKDHNQDI